MIYLSFFGFQLWISSKEASIVTISVSFEGLYFSKELSQGINATQEASLARFPLVEAPFHGSIVSTETSDATNEERKSKNSRSIINLEASKLTMDLSDATTRDSTVANQASIATIYLSVVTFQASSDADEASGARANGAAS